MLFMLSQIDKTLASGVAAGLGLKVPTRIDGPLNQSIPADGDPKKFQPQRVKQDVGISRALSMADTRKDTIMTRKVAFLAADGFDDASLAAIKKALVKAGAVVKIVAPRLGTVVGRGGTELKIDFSFLTCNSVLFDAVYVPGGEKSVAALKREADAIHFLNETYKHCKAIAATAEGIDLLTAAFLKADSSAGKRKADTVVVEEGVIISRSRQDGKVATEFIKAIAQHRAWSREQRDQVPA